MQESYAIRSKCISLNQSNVGVLVGMSFWDYAIESEQFLSTTGESLKLTGRNLSVSSGRISFLFGYNGIAMTIDTACSSGLVAVHSASHLLQREPLSSVLAGAVMLSLSPDVLKCLSSASMISAEGRSLTLDHRASGYGRGEACAVMCISQSKTGDAKLSGSAINQDGRSASLTAPNGPSQVKLAVQAYQSAALDPSQILLHELHGTGTPLGDPIELLGVATCQTYASESFVGSSHPLALSASKTAMGHSEPAAGCLGIESLLRQLSNRVHHPVLGLHNINHHVESVLRESVRKLLPLRSNGGLAEICTSDIGSVSAFAFQGTNAMVILHVSSFKTDVPNLHEDPGYRWIRHWFVDRVHPLLAPSQCSPQRSRWALKFPASISASMRQHRVLDKLLLPGLAMFRLMSDTALCSHGNLAQHHDAVSITKCSILHPIFLNHELSLLIEADIQGGALKLLSSKQNAVEIHALSHAAMSWHSSAVNQPLCRYRVLHHTTDFGCQNTLIGDLFMPKGADREFGPSIESLDAMTHLAAYKETFLRIGVSIPIACEHLLSKISRGVGTINAVNHAVAVDEGAIENRSRNFSLLYPCGRVKAGSFQSRPIHPELGRKKTLLLYFEEKQIHSSLRLGSRHDHLNDFCDRLRGLHQSGMKNRCVLSYLLFVQYVRETRAGTSSSFSSSSTFSDLLEPQIRVSQREMGTHSNVTYHDRTTAGRNGSSFKHTLSMQSFEPESNYCKGSMSTVMHGSSVHVITGGTNGIGQAFGLWTAVHCAGMKSRVLFLLGKNGLFRNHFDIHSSQLVIISKHDCSLMSDNETLKEMCFHTGASRVSLVHGAGIVNDRLVINMDVKSSNQVFGPKYFGARSLISSMGYMTPVHSLLCFSTASIDIGNSGQSNYIAANSAMELVSSEIRIFGLPSHFVRFGPWKDIGMLAGRDKLSMALHRNGVSPMSTVQGLETTISFLKCSLDAVTVGHFDWNIVRSKEKFNVPSNIPTSGSPSKSTIHADNFRDLIYDILEKFLGKMEISDDDPIFQVGELCI